MPDNLKVWTTVGSVGTLNKADLAKVTLNGSIIQLGVEVVSSGGGSAATSPSAPIQNTVQAVERYNLTPVDGLFLTERFDIISKSASGITSPPSWRRTS